MRKIILNGLALVVASVVLAMPTPSFAASSATQSCGLWCNSAPEVSTDSTGLDVSRQVDVPSSATQAVETTYRSRCSTCRWALVPACELSATQPGSDSQCVHVLGICPTGLVAFRVYMRPTPTAPWQVTGTTCLALGQATSGTPTLNVPASVANYFQHMPLPPPNPSFQPAAGAVVNIPTVFNAGNAAPDASTFNLGGTSVQVSAHPSYWIWTFDSGVSERFSRPGGPYPDTDVTYTYHQPGIRQVTVTAVWTATYSYGGQTLPVSGTVSRSATLPVPVNVARSQLVAQ